METSSWTPPESEIKSADCDASPRKES
jgi:hypothetical protein